MQKPDKYSTGFFLYVFWIGMATECLGLLFGCLGLQMRVFAAVERDSL